MSLTVDSAVSYAGLLIKLQEALNNVYPSLENDKDVDSALLHLCEVSRLCEHTKAWLIQKGRK